MRRRCIFQYLTFTFLLGCLACQQEPSDSNLEVADEASLAPQFFSDHNGQVYISWLSTPTEDKSILYFSKYESGNWSPKKKIAAGDNWFVNWADFPSVTIHSEDPQLWLAHWLQYTADGTYDYEVRMALSHDAGASWGDSFVSHLDAVPAEHGFFSVVADDAGFFKAVWLDGRFTKGHEEVETKGHHSHGAGSMTLRTARIDAQGNISNSEELDDRVCDCCQTAMAQAASGTLVLYRDRSEEEIRDISLLRSIENDWQSPQPFSNDNWKISGCPVNGPVLRSDRNNVVAAWYTQANQAAKVKFAISKDGGLSFDTRMRVDEGDSFGRVDVAMLKNAFLISMVEATADDGAEIIIKKIDFDNANQQIIHRQEVSPTRASGFPKLMPINDHDCLLAWTAVAEEQTNVQVSIFKY